MSTYLEAVRADLAILLNKIADEVSIIDCCLTELVALNLKGESGKIAKDAWATGRKLVATVHALRDLLG